MGLTHRTHISSFFFYQPEVQPTLICRSLRIFKSMIPNKNHRIFRVATCFISIFFGVVRNVRFFQGREFTAIYGFTPSICTYPRIPKAIKKTGVPLKTVFQKAHFHFQGIVFESLFPSSPSGLYKNETSQYLCKMEPRPAWKAWKPVYFPHFKFETSRSEHMVMPSKYVQCKMCWNMAKKQKSWDLKINIINARNMQGIQNPWGYT